MSEGEERKLRLNGRVDQLRRMEAEGINVKARMGSAEREVEAALIQWRAKPAALDATVKLVGDQLVYVDNTDYGSLATRTRPDEVREREWATDIPVDTLIPTVQEQAEINRRLKLEPKSK